MGNGRYRTSDIKLLGSERGAALLLVLWVGVFFGVVLTAFAFSMRTELDAARNFREGAEASMLAKAGIARALADLVNTRTKAGVTSAPFRSSRSGPVRLGRGTYRVIVTDEESRISLNRAPAEVLRRLLRNTGVSDVHLVDTIVDSILDWRDQDDLHRLSGAEAAYYRALPVPYYPKNGPFEVVEEMLLVKGMTREIFYGNVRDPDHLAVLRNRSPEERDFRSGEYLGIRPFLTVHSSGQVDPNTASLDVLVASGLPGPQAQEILRSRRSAPISGRLPHASGGVRWTRTPHAYRIESIGRVNASPIVSRIVATVVKEGTARRPRFRVVAWHEGLG